MIKTATCNFRLNCKFYQSITDANLASSNERADNNYIFIVSNNGFLGGHPTRVIKDGTVCMFYAERHNQLFLFYARLIDR